MPNPKHNTSTTTLSRSEDAPPHEAEKKIPVQVPFLQALKTEKVSKNEGEILENLKQVKINLPLLHVIKQVPAYAKVIKDLRTMKRKHHVKKIAFLTEQENAVIQRFWLSHNFLPNRHI